MIDIAILGYGNLGKAIERTIEKNNEFNLVGIFSRRRLDSPHYFDASTLHQFDGNIDVVLVCTGSLDDTVNTVKKLAGRLCTVDAYDIHSNVTNFQQSVDCLAKQGKTTNIVAVGWDPGILSMVRATCSIVKGQCVTLWGKGVSQGHTNALKKVAGVVDGVQFTLPKHSAYRKALRGRFKGDSKDVCTRRCYVVASTKKGVKRRIRAIKEYFDGYKTDVRFVSHKRLAKLKQNSAHKGQVVFAGNNCKMKFRLATQCNAMLTAEIMLAYAKVAKTMYSQGKFGAYTCLDIPLKYFCKGGEL